VYLRASHAFNDSLFAYKKINKAWIGLFLI